MRKDNMFYTEKWTGKKTDSYFYDVKNIFCDQIKMIPEAMDFSDISL